jgi:AcrR family transcriptional regulator
LSGQVVHEKRKQDILEKALDVFVEEGYEDTTFQKIAERCGITRTILYLYFDNKKQIFAESIKRFLGALESEIATVAHDEHVDSEEKLLKIGDMVVEACEKESKLLSVVMDYLLRLRASGGNPDEKVRRRTVRMRHILADIVIEGKRRGDFSEVSSVKGTVEMFFALVEAAVFRLVVLGRKEATGLRVALSPFVQSMRGPSRGLEGERIEP